MPFRAPSQRAVTPQGRGRFPGYDVLSQAHRWDDVTAGVVLARLAPATSLSFFTDAEQAVASPLFDLLLAQDCEPRVPVLQLVDARLAAGETDGWHFDDMPQDSEAWRLTLGWLDDDAKDHYSQGFSSLAGQLRGRLLSGLAEAGDGALWHGLPTARVWSLWTRYACTAFYSHPWAWNEIGFGGPAYPRGYKATAADAREPWEVRDASGTDPVQFAARVESAQQARERLGDDAQ